ncbi:hypothetical protein [Gordonia sp. (in: high G+C Gram-positive bacteria)]|uniref:hypothetical protein n=1 Tax=Gordonia sp. (in: high G+C Gram-positive bacteria) TaxID=84139 RepID=UPI0026100854|nr:hypothetical protein [Gordonia sp. (in: high G+C Gram-positive bacteria)]
MAATYHGRFGGIVVFVVVLLTWIGRAAWPNRAHLPDGVAIHMGWAYYASLGLAAMLLVVPWAVARAPAR